MQSLLGWFDSFQPLDLWIAAQKQPSFVGHFFQAFSGPYLFSPDIDVWPGPEWRGPIVGRMTAGFGSSSFKGHYISWLTVHMLR